MKELAVPLFPHYVFCRFQVRERLSILRAPAPVHDEEIADLHTAVASGLPCRPWPYLKTGTVVREKSDWRLILSVQMLQRSAAVEVNREDVVPN